MVVAPNNDLYRCWNGHLFRAAACPICWQKAEDCKRVSRHDAMGHIRAVSEVEEKKEKDKVAEKARKYHETSKLKIWRLDSKVLRPLFEDYLEKNSLESLHKVTGLTLNKIDNVLGTSLRRQEATQRVLEQIEDFTGLSREQFAVQKGKKGK